MELTRIALDKFVLSGLFVSEDILSSHIAKTIFDGLGLASDDFKVMTGKRGVTCYFSKDYGIDIKLDSNYHFTIEFHSTFFCDENAFDLIRSLFLTLSKYTETQLSINELHIAQDYTKIQVSDFFKEGFENPKYVKCFNVLYNSLLKVKLREDSKTFYLRDPGAKGSKWSMCFYDKTKELNENKSQASKFKNEYYKKLGYFDNQITRIELKLNSQLSKIHFDNFFKVKTMDEFCKGVLVTFYKKRKIYELKKDQKFDKKHSERFKKYKLWEQIFENDSEPILNQTKDELFFLEILTLEQLKTRMTNLLATYPHSLSTEEIKEIILNSRVKLKERFKRKEETIEKRKKLLKNFSLNSNEIIVKDKKNKFVPNRSLSTFYSKR